MLHIATDIKVLHIATDIKVLHIATDIKVLYIATDIKVTAYSNHSHINNIFSHRTLHYVSKFLIPVANDLISPETFLQFETTHQESKYVSKKGVLLKTFFPLCCKKLKN